MRSSWRFVSFILVVLLHSTSTSAQFSVGMSAGPQFALLSDKFTLTSFPEPGQSFANYKTVSASYGEGLVLQIDVAYRYRQYLFGMVYSGLVSNKQVLSDSESARFLPVEINGDVQRIVPYVQVFAPLGKGLWSFYLKAGALIAIHAETAVGTGISGGTNSFRYLSRRFEDDRRWSGGGYAGIGFAYELSKHWELMLGAQTFFQEFQPKRSVIIAYEIDGQDRLDSISPLERETVFVDVIDNSTAGSATQVRQSPSSFTQSFSSIGLELNIRYYLSAR